MMKTSHTLMMGVASLGLVISLVLAVPTPEAGVAASSSLHRVRRQAGTNSGLSCRGGDGQFEYLPDCGMYVQCDQGVPTLLPCQQGLEFNPDRGYCDWPGQGPSRCTRQAQTVSGSLSGPPSQMVNYDVCSGIPNGGDEINGFHVAHPTICNAFYTCHSYTINAPCIFCPENEFFSPIDRRCHVGTARECQGREYVPHDQKVYRQLDGSCTDTGVRRGRGQRFRGSTRRGVVPQGRGGRTQRPASYYQRNGGNSRDRDSDSNDWGSNNSRDWDSDNNSRNWNSYRRNLNTGDRRDRDNDNGRDWDSGNNRNWRYDNGRGWEYDNGRDWDSGNNRNWRYDNGRGWEYDN